MTATAARLGTLGKSMDLPGKAAAREVVGFVGQEMRAISILDLFGGGASAQVFRRLNPSAALIEAESDRGQWPALIQQAQMEGFGYHLGPVESAEGRFDLIYLDLMAPISGGLKESIVACRRKLNPDGILAVTVMPARERDTIFTGDERLDMVALWLEKVSGMGVRVYFPYFRSRGQSMWLFALHRYQNSWLRWNKVYDIRQDGYLSVGMSYLAEEVIEKYLGYVCGNCGLLVCKRGHRHQRWARVPPSARLIPAPDDGRDAQ